MHSDYASNSYEQACLQVLLGVKGLQASRAQLPQQVSSCRTAAILVMLTRALVLPPCCKPSLLRCNYRRPPSPLPLRFCGFPLDCRWFIIL
jgi:hypothetical protein